MARAPRKRSFGSIDKLPSGRFRAQYYTGQGAVRVRHKAPMTYRTEKEAKAFLTTVEADILRGTWKAPEAGKTMTLEVFAAEWIARQEARGLKPRTLEEYRRQLDKRILPGLGKLAVRAIGVRDVSKWHDALPDTPSFNAHAYSLLSTLMKDAVREELREGNPCVLRGAGSAKPKRSGQVVTADQVNALMDAMPEAYRVMVLFGSWCAMRQGEICALRRSSITVEGAVPFAPTVKIAITDGVVTVAGRRELGTPKTDAGRRELYAPAHIVPAILAHIAKHVGPDQTDLLFPAVNGGFLAPGTFARWWYKARAAAGVPDLKFHDLRHTGAVWATESGVSAFLVQQRLGHATPNAAIRYQHRTDTGARSTAELLGAGR